jgi:hypothetical protein
LLEPRIPFRVLESWIFQGGDNGKGTFAVAFGRADSGDHFVMAVVRPLISGDRRYRASIRLRRQRSLIFEGNIAERHSAIVMRHGLFS